MENPLINSRERERERERERVRERERERRAKKFWLGSYFSNPK